MAAGFITYLSSAPEDVRKATMSKWCEAAGLQGFDFRRFMSTESEQLGWKAEGLPSDDLSMENALVILKVSSFTTLWPVLQYQKASYENAAINHHIKPSNPMKRLNRRVKVSDLVFVHNRI